jgi:hypothetical protein
MHGQINPGISPGLFYPHKFKFESDNNRTPEYIQIKTVSDNW